MYRKAIPAGMISGAGGQFLASPADLVKIRLQVEGKRVLEGHPPRLEQGHHAPNWCNSHPCTVSMCTNKHFHYQECNYL